MRFSYYPVQQKWTKRIVPHLGDELLNKVLTRDFNKYTDGRWRTPFTAGQFPCEFDAADWSLHHRGRPPRYWAYVKHGACHWLVNFYLRLAMLSEPDIPWRISMSIKHSTVWDGAETLFDLGFLALGVPPQECFDNAYDYVLPIGKFRKVGFPPYWEDDVSRSR